MSKNWIQSASGLAVDLVSPTPDMICIEDIAHALSRICRYTGHTSRHYSVAEHSLLVCDLLSSAGVEIQLQGLLHDATEAYLGDVSSPLKALLPDYKRLEALMASVIAAKFELPEIEDPAVKEADMIALFSEKAMLLGAPPKPWFTAEREPDKMICARIKIGTYSLFTSEKFLDRFEYLSLAVRRLREKLPNAA